MSNHKDLQNPDAFPGTDARGFGSIGMSLRDYFAGQFVTGFVSIGFTGPRDKQFFFFFSEKAYMLADAMLAERMKDQ